MEGREIIKRTLAVVGIVMIVGYSYFVLSGFLRGPRIVISNPSSGLATTTQALLIAGQAIHLNKLFLNGTPISFDLAGNFHETVLLAKGYNRVTISGTDRYDRTVEKQVDITLLTQHREPDPAPPPKTNETREASTTTEQTINI